MDLAASYSHELRPVGTNVYQMVTGDDSEDDRRRWDHLYDTSNYVFGKEPASFLRRNIQLLPPGRVLDIAMGEGRNSVFLAKNGFIVDGIDISEVALRKAKRLALENHVSFTTILADLNNYSIKPETYQVILNFDYLQKSLIPQIKRGLKKKGVVLYENLTINQVIGREGQSSRREYILHPGELKELFKDFEILVYEESQGRASLIARKP